MYSGGLGTLSGKADAVNRLPLSLCVFCPDPSRQQLPLQPEPCLHVHPHFASDRRGSGIREQVVFLKSHHPWISTHFSSKPHVRPTREESLLTWNPDSRART